ncbi:hypothetical protein [Actinophytocola glycyrrhizae]|uniref:Uncharacterized protein n=1 Tax=Actinophytocola glycyrrhizae TaxID=2044873 RepID=A0ABV9SAU5_9PSEU
MTHRWSHEGSPTFDDRTAAEEWLSANWQDLVDAGVDQVTLLDGDEVVYGPMSLHPAD